MSRMNESERLNEIAKEVIAEEKKDPVFREHVERIQEDSARKLLGRIPGVRGRDARSKVAKKYAAEKHPGDGQAEKLDKDNLARLVEKQLEHKIDRYIDSEFIEENVEGNDDDVLERLDDSSIEINSYRGRR